MTHAGRVTTAAAEDAVRTGRLARRAPCRCVPWSPGVRAGGSAGARVAVAREPLGGGGGWKAPKFAPAPSVGAGRDGEDQAPGGGTTGERPVRTPVTTPTGAGMTPFEEP